MFIFHTRECLQHSMAMELHSREIFWGLWALPKGEIYVHRVSVARDGRV